MLQPWGFSARYESNTLVIAQKPALDRSSGVKNKTVCLDPGHNPDSGAIGPRGFTEREANLKIGLALEKMLLAAGARVVFTHRDEPLPLQQRRSAALLSNPDIFVSLHNNSIPDGTDPRTNYGTGTYYYHPQSKALADTVHASMLAELGWPDQRVNQKSLAVCRISEFPAILVEPAYIILPDQEKLLMSEEGQKKIAKAVFDGIKNFFEPSKK
jgi:N-acetylmuramoyl-L-alanine amidase